MLDRNTILIGLAESDNTKFGKEDFATQSRPQKVFSSIWSLEAEVNNGGFSQYFQNSSAETAPFVVEALDAIGAAQAAQICQRAIAIAFPNGMPTRREAIQFVADNFSDETLTALDKLDQEFFSYPDNLTDLLFDYVAGKPEEFGDLSD